MRNWILLATAIGILGTESSSAQISPSLSQSLQNRRSHHIDSLRRVLKLSPHLHLDWRTSTNGLDTLQVIDDFNRESVGPDWGCNPEFWQIVDGELWITPAAIYSFRYLAAFLPVYNRPERRIYSVAYRWGKKADEAGIREGSHALMLDEPSANGSGYWLWHRTNWFEVWLWIVKNGTWEYTPGEHKEVDRAPSKLQMNPQAGDVITAYIRQEPDANYFDYYVNEELDATLKDVTKEYPKRDIWHVGIFLFGFDRDTNQQLNNQIDDFTVTWVEGDVVAPARVADLRATESTATSVNLEWTSTGDNGVDGDATRLALRYSTAPITAANFASAKLVPNLPAPKSSGVKQKFEVIRLGSYTTYYFALKIIDEADNASPLSNIAIMKTKAATPAKLLAVSGNGQIVSIGKTAPLPLVARLTDQYGNPNSVREVRFQITAGGGSFLNGQGAAGKFYKISTDSSGQALAKVTASNVYGDTTKITAKWTNSTNTLTLTTSFMVVAARPDSLIAIKGNNQTAARGTILPDSLVVQILDAANAPVKNYAVTFRVLSGGGKLANNQTQVNVNTDGRGLTKTKWTLGMVAGVQQVEASAAFNGKNLRHAPFVFKATASIPSAVEEETAAIPQQFALHQNFPNPFWSEATSRSAGNPETTIQFDLPEAGQAEMNVYDLSGRRVRQLLAATLPPASHRLVWNGQDDNGQPVNTGVYFLVLRAQMGGASGALVATRKVVLMK